MRRLQAVDGWLFVDPSRRTGLLYVDFPALRQGTAFVLRKPTRAEELMVYRRELEKVAGILLDGKVPAVVCVEAYPAKAKGSAVQKQAELGGLVRAYFAALAPVVEINPATWKSLTFRGEKGTKAKDLEYMLRAQRCTGAEIGSFANVDEVDCLLMAWAANIMLTELDRRSAGITTFRNQVFAARGSV